MHLLRNTSTTFQYMENVLCKILHYILQYIPICVCFVRVAAGSVVLRAHLSSSMSSRGLVSVSSH